MMENTAIGALLHLWRLEAKEYEDAAAQDDIDETEQLLNKFMADLLRKCIKDLEEVHEGKTKG